VSINRRAFSLIVFSALLVALSQRLRADSGTCGGATAVVPFTDVGGSIFFCQIAEAYFSGLTKGTSATTYSPSEAVTREQMAAFVTRTLDQSLRRRSRRAALGQWWTTTPHYDAGLGSTMISDATFLADAVTSDGKDLWVTQASLSGVNSVLRLHGSDGRLLASWNGPDQPRGITTAMGKVFVAQASDVIPPQPSLLYTIDPAQAPGAATQVPTTNPLGADVFVRGHNILFDGARLWITNSRVDGGAGSVDIVTPAAAFPWTSSNISNGFLQPYGLVFDGSNMWVTDIANQTIDKMDSNGGFVQIITVGNQPTNPAFDGANIWVPNISDNSISVVRASTGIVIATLTGNGLDEPESVAFDGQRILAANRGSISLWKASDLTPMGSFSIAQNNNPRATSDGINFWILLSGAGGNFLARF
jgi:hypothetical protein